MRRTFPFILTAWAAATLAAQDTIRLQLHTPATEVTDTVHLEEVEVKARKTPRTASRFSDLHPVELVTTGGSNGDLYKALQTLPGTQTHGESGKLLVRGGSEEETQTFIDGMHVLNPYTGTSNTSPARSRYSTFLFGGINLATGGAPSEYGQALSAVLPLETKDKSLVNKLGLNASIVGLGGGGTRAWGKGSLSLDLNLQDLTIYDRWFPARQRSESPYRMESAAAQLRLTPDGRTTCKLYAQYDRTDLAVDEGTAADRHLFALNEDNAYLNATLRRLSPGGWEWFAGAAWSWFDRRIEGATQPDDHYNALHQEIHLKTKVKGRLTEKTRMEAGVETYIRDFREELRMRDGDVAGADIHPSLGAAFASVTYFPLEDLKAEASLRTEYDHIARRVEALPRLAIHYYMGDFLLSAVAGRYAQQVETGYLLRAQRLRPALCTQWNAGVQYNLNGRLLRAEAYYKDYDRLPLWKDGVACGVPTNGGSGHSKGFDLYFRDPTSVHRVEYSLSYTYNTGRRRYATYTDPTVPQYATRHNLCAVLKWDIPALRTIVGMTNIFASGRPIHNPDRPGLLNDEARPYHSLDVGLTYLPHRKVIVHASLTNVLGRRNEYGRYDDGSPVLNMRDRFFYIGVFVTLGRKAAYDVSNF